ncbi:PD-(D/E)XK nuclease family protein [Spongiactinospora sp. 9N601]|uniref:PD-(D/E)XK nuclease family protein n=1 Tax=Spongiactinospora sp. 9N601 TaxID=3375149 RepID=UPI0037A46A4D
MIEMTPPGSEPTSRTFERRNDWQTGWQMPPGVSGDASLLRFRPSSIKGPESGCPQRLALKVRPGLLWPAQPDRPAQRMETYGMGPFYRVLDSIEFDGMSPEAAVARWQERSKRPFHPALIRWTEHAVQHFRSAMARYRSGRTPLKPVSRDWIRERPPTENGTVAGEELATGRRYEGHGIRELWIPRPDTVEDRERHEGEIAVAAAVLAEGRPLLNRLWRGTRAILGRYERPDRVRIIEVGCVDGSLNVLFDDTPEAAIVKYRRDAEESLRDAAVGNDHRPGYDCVTCPLLATCPAVPSHPGLLGIHDDSKPLRSWSLTTVREHRTCGPIPHFRELRLPSDGGAKESEATLRGRAVHDWIEKRHRRSPLQPCRGDDVPDPQADQGQVMLPNDGFQTRLGIQMIGDHSLVCPLRGADEHARALPEHVVVVYDPAANTVVIAKIDLLYRVKGEWRFRETKTSRYLNEGDLLKRYPQISLAVLLSAEGLLPGGPGGCRVELERLTANGPVLTEFDVHDPDLVADAREVVRSHVHDWHGDETLATKPGTACAECGFTRWCSDAVPGAAS